MPKVFLCHCHKKAALARFVTEFLEVLGFKAVLARTEPFQGRTLGEQVEHLLDNCDAAVILATKDRKQKSHYVPSESVIKEHGMISVHPRMKGRLVVFKEKGVQLDALSNGAYHGFVYSDRGKICFGLAVELQAMGLLGGAIQTQLGAPLSAMPGADDIVQRLREWAEQADEKGYDNLKAELPGLVVAFFEMAIKGRD
ncbi:MAG: nucleotide-binding protein [Proteobacteria bacterium]|nr:nucleotide-binding protein [Pseudomonadota bacterium]